MNTLSSLYLNRKNRGLYPGKGESRNTQCMEEYINQAERLSFSEYRIFYWELLARLRYHKQTCNEGQRERYLQAT